MGLTINSNIKEEPIHWRKQYSNPQNNSPVFITASGDFGDFILKRIKRKGFTIYQSDYLPAKDIQILNNNPAPFLGLVIMYKNELLFNCNDKQDFYLMANHFVFAYVPVQEYTTRMAGERMYSTLTIHFSSRIVKDLFGNYPGLNSLLKSVIKRNNHILSKDEYFISRDMLTVVDEIMQDNFAKDLREILVDLKVKELLVKTLAHMMNISDHKRALMNKEEKEKIMKVPGVIMENESSLVKRTALAKRVSINSTKLKEGFKKLYGLTIQDWQQRHRLWEARCLLLYTNKPLETIADKIGYSDAAAFSKAFKKFFHLSPNAFRHGETSGS